MIRSIIKLPKDLQIFLFQKRVMGPFGGENIENVRFCYKKRDEESISLKTGVL
jgi:hypothetical protein